METSPPLSLAGTTVFLLLLLSHISNVSGFNDVAEACKNIIDKDGEDAGPTYEFCLTSLQVLTGAKHADLQHIAFLSANLTVANATHTERIVKELSKNEKRNVVKAAYQTCMDCYDEIVQNARTAANEILPNKNYVTANKVISSAMSAVDNCKDEFDDSSVKSPIFKENNDMHALLGILIRFIVKLQEWFLHAIIY